MTAFDEWLDAGMRAGWCGPPFCSTHDSTPTSAEEDEESDGGGYACIHALRLYESRAVKVAVEKNHSPSMWRGLGLA